jgi:iron complex outermembrane recepter protein
VRRLLILPLLLLVLPAAAQPGTLTGTVVDAENGTPIPTVTVAVRTAADAELITGTVTDLEGRFRIDRIPAGNYTVEVSFVGYETHRIEGVALQAGAGRDLGTIRLAPDVAYLDEVEVIAERRGVEVQIDRTVYNIGDDPLATGATVTDMLETLPSVDVDFDGNISLRGSGSVTVFINGRPAPVPADMVGDYLAQLPAERVDRVEIIPNPSARYAPEGTAGVLNIVLKEERDLGLGGSLSATADSRGSVNTTNMLTYGRGPLTLAATYSLRRGLRERTRSLYRINRLQETFSAFGEDGIDDHTRTNHMLGLNSDYRLARRTTLTTSLRVTTFDQDEERQLTSLRLDQANNVLGVRERISDEDEWRRGADIRVGMRHAFDASNDHRLSAQARADYQVRERNERLLDRPAEGNHGHFREQVTRFDRTDRRASLEVDYVRPVAGFRAEAGYSGFVRLQKRDFVSQSRFEPGAPLETDIGLTNVGEYALWIHALYAQAARDLGRLGVQAGVRLETALTDFTLRNTGESFVHQYVSAFPSLFAGYELSENDRLRASYSRRINRPRTDHLNPFPRFDDPLNIYVGNPEIRPEFIDAVELSYVRFTPWGSLNFSPYGRRATDVIRYIVRMDDGVAVRTIQNLDTVVSYGVETVLSYENDALRSFVSFEGFRQVTDGAIEGGSVANDAFGWGGRLNMSYRLGRLGLPGATIQAMARYRAPMRTEQGRTHARMFTNLAFRQNFLDDRLSLNVRFRDPLGTAGWSYVIDQPALYQEVDSSWGAQRVAVSLSYRFNQPDRRRQRDGGPDEENGFADDPLQSLPGE